MSAGDATDLAPRCGKRKGEFKDGGLGRFRYLVICGACWSAGPARIKDVAVKLWNEAKSTGRSGGPINADRL
jgi:hypothetical protein